MKKRIPYAVGNFEEIVRGDYFFVDKTRYIADLEEWKVPVFLRPRRFGKSLWCSVLECYYDVNRADRFEELFGQFAIGRAPTSERNRYLVIRLNFSVVEVRADIAHIRESFDRVCNRAFSVFLSQHRDYFPDGLECSGTASDTLGAILSHVRETGAPPVYVVIDEYDNFANQLITTRRDTLYRDLTTGDSFFRTFFKVIKAGIEDLSVGRVFITGVLPITMDDLTSGFNIAEIITLEPNTLSMLGFTQAEVDHYVAQVFDEYGLDGSRLDEVLGLLESYYNGYRFLPGAADTLYNSTILNFYLKKLVTRKGEIPREFIDDNVRTDLSWLQRLSSDERDTRELIETLLFENELPYDIDMLSSKFNMNQFFEKDFYPVSLFYLGMLTVKDDFRMAFPNQTLAKIFTEYFNTVERIEVSRGYGGYFERFLEDLDLEALFAGYWETYVGQIPAQAFDKVNENFFRTTFYELCTRYLSTRFAFSIEVNYPSGRCDWEMLGKYHTEHCDLKYLVEFKYFTNEEGQRRGILDIDAPFPEDVEQVAGFERDNLAKFPAYRITKHIIYVVGNRGYRFFRLPTPVE